MANTLVLGILDSCLGVRLASLALEGLHAWLTPLLIGEKRGLGGLKDLSSLPLLKNGNQFERGGHCFEGLKVTNPNH